MVGAVVLIAFVFGFVLGGTGSSATATGESFRSIPAVTSTPSLDRSLPLTARPLPTRDRNLKTIVISTAVSYKLHDWERFLIPLRRVYDGDVAVLVAASEKEVWGEVAARHGVRVVPLDEKVLAGKPKSLASANAVKKARYAQYNRLCAPYDWCLATDFRDVFFQADPFARLPTGFDLALTQEWSGYPIGKCHVNSEWLLSCWSKTFYESVKRKPIICSGTVLATPRGFVELGEAMLAEYGRTAGKRGCFARDQGHLIYLQYSGELERRLPGRVLLQVPSPSALPLSFLSLTLFPLGQESGRGAAMSLALLNPQAIARFVQRRMVHNADGDPTPVAHQFDRWHALNTMFEWQLLLYKQQAAAGVVHIRDK